MIVVHDRSNDETVTSAAPLVVHILASDLYRGAQAEARTVCDALAGGAVRHEALTIFAGETANLRAEHSLAVSGALRRCGVDPWAVAALHRWRRIHRPRVVIAHGSEAVRYALLAFPRSAIVYRRIGVADGRAHRAPRRWLHRLLHRLPCKVFAVSTSVAVDAAGFGRPDAVVIPNCRSIGGFERRKEPVRQPVRVLFAGQLVASKRPGWFLDAVEAAQDAGVDIRWSMAGDGPLRDRLAARSVPGGALLGPRDDMPAVLAEHDVLVFTSRSDGEGMPGILIEAGLAGCAVVSTDAPGARDVVADGLTGVVVGLDAHAGLLDAVIALARDADAVTAMGRAGRERCEQRFSADIVAQEWAEEIERSA